MCIYPMHANANRKDSKKNETECFDLIFVWIFYCG